MGLAIVLGACLASACDEGASSEPLTEAAEIEANLLAAGYRSRDIEIAPDGGVIVQRDVRVSLDASEAMRGNGFRHYVTFVTVSPSIKKIWVYIDPRLRARNRDFITNVEDALAEWNGIENIWLSFDNSPGALPPSPGAGEAVIELTEWQNPPACGSNQNDINAEATFPSSDGRPGPEIKINPCLLGKSAINQKSTIMHEIGHTMGFRHTDYNSQASCGGAPFDEGGPPAGAIRVPCSPEAKTTDTRSPDPDSILNACAPAQQTGVWSSADRAAIGLVYLDS